MRKTGSGHVMMFPTAAYQAENAIGSFCRVSERIGLTARRSSQTADCGIDISSLFVTTGWPLRMELTLWRRQIHLNARAMTPRSAPDINNHQTRSNARAACNPAIDFSTLANDFSMLMANAITVSFRLSILVDSF